MMSNPRTLISSGSPFEASVGFSRAVRVGNHVSVAGTAPIGTDGKPAAVGDAAGQTRRCFDIASAALASAGASLADVVRTRIYLVDIKDWPEAAKVHGELFSSIRPACTVVEVSALIDPLWRVEIEVDAIVSSDAPWTGAHERG